MNQYIKYNKILLIILIVTLASCSIGKKKETKIYTIKPAYSTILEQSCKTKFHPTLQIIEPEVASGLESRRIAILQANNRMNYYKSVRWAAPVSEMLQTSLLDAFEKTPAFASVATDLDEITPELILITDIRDFQVNLKDAPSVHIRLVSKLIDTKTHKIIVTIPVEKTLIPEIYKMEQLVISFDKAAANSISDIVERSVAALPCK